MTTFNPYHPDITLPELQAFMVKQFPYVNVEENMSKSSLQGLAKKWIDISAQASSYDDKKQTGNDQDTVDRCDQQTDPAGLKPKKKRLNNPSISPNHNKTPTPQNRRSLSSPVRTKQSTTRAENEDIQEPRTRSRARRARISDLAAKPIKNRRNRDEPQGSMTIDTNKAKVPNGTATTKIITQPNPIPQSSSPLTSLSNLENRWIDCVLIKPLNAAAPSTSAITASRKEPLFANLTPQVKEEQPVSINHPSCSSHNCHKDISELRERVQKLEDLVFSGLCRLPEA